MINKMKKISFLLILMFCAGIGRIHALGIYANTGTVTIGSSVAVTVNASGLAGRFSVTSSNGGVLSGGTSSTWIEDSSQTYTFRANGVGSATITVTPVDVADYNGNAVTGAKSVTINVIAKPVVVLSSDNSLASLGVEGKELSPGFSNDISEYSVELEPETTSININASPSHGGASIAGAGAREVVDGENRLEIIVTAENGSQRTYIINASVKEYNPIEQTVDDKPYTVVRKKKLLTPPENYKETTVKIGEEEVPAYTSEVTKYTLVGLKNESGNIDLYVYEDGKYTLYKEYTFNKIIFYPLAPKEGIIPQNYKKSKITYNEQTLDAYRLDEASDYALLYGMNIETGEIHLYMYDEKEDTLQIYNNEETLLLNEQMEELKLVILILSGVVIFLFFLCIIIGFKKKSKKEKDDFNTLDEIEVKEVVAPELEEAKARHAKKKGKQLRQEKKQQKLEKKLQKEEEKLRIREEKKLRKLEKKKGKKKEKDDEVIDVRKLQ